SVSAPVVCDFRSAALSFCFSCSTSKPLRMGNHFFSGSEAFNHDRESLGIPLEVAIRKWNEGNYPSEPGEYKDLPIFEKPEVLIDNGYGELVPIKFTIALLVEQQLYFGKLPISQLSGFKDELTGSLITNAFTTGILDLNDVLENWEPFSLEEKPPVKPLLTLTGLFGREA
ncbi:MAG: hypothetical protein V3R64_08855, partial [Sphingomonadales bacterium]